jgi:hypothetical protein
MDLRGYSDGWRSDFMEVQEMSILIKGMEMPTRCCDCKMYVEDIYCCHLLHRQIENPWADDGVELDCPLVPVPPHGRLIDADVLSQMFDPDESFGAAVLEIIEDTPTIIPAEPFNNLSKPFKEEGE